MILLAGAAFVSASASYNYTTKWFYGGNPVNGVRALTYTCNDANCNSLTKINDISSSTNSITVSYPIPSPAYGYATYWVAPGFAYQEMAWKPAGSGSFTQNVNFTKYNNSRANINSFSAPASVNEGSTWNAVVNVSSPISEAPLLPYGEPNEADIITNYLSANTSITLTIRNSTNDIVFSEIRTDNISEDKSAVESFSWTPSYAQAGSYTAEIKTRAVDSKCINPVENTQTKQLVVNDVSLGDITAPKYSNLVINPASPAAYAPAQQYKFNSTWTDDSSVASAWINFNGTNYTAVKNGDVYSFAVSDLKAGNYSYKWFANDTAGNTNSTGLLNYIVDKAVPALAINMLPASNVVNNTQTNVSGTGCPSQLTCKLYRDGAEIIGSDISILAIGSYSYVYSTAGNENYTSASVSRVLTITTEAEEEEETKTHVISDEELKEGHSVSLNEGDKIKFSLCGAPYYIKLSEIDNDEAIFTITPSGKFTLEEDESTNLYLAEAKMSDIYFELESLTSIRAKILVKKNAGFICPVVESPPILIAEEGKIVLGGEKSAKQDILSSIAIGLLIGVIILGILDSALAIAKPRKTIKPRKLVKYNPDNSKVL